MLLIIIVSITVKMIVRIGETIKLAKPVAVKNPLVFPALISPLTYMCVVYISSVHKPI